MRLGLTIISLEATGTEEPRIESQTHHCQCQNSGKETNSDEGRGNPWVIFFMSFLAWRRDCSPGIIR